MNKNTHLNKRHVDLIHVGSLLSVQFDADKVVTENFANFFILKRLPLHDMAPMACWVAHWWPERDLAHMHTESLESYFTHPVILSTLRGFWQNISINRLNFSICQIPEKNILRDSIMCTKAGIGWVNGIWPDKKIGLSSFFALSKASCPHGYLQKTLHEIAYIFYLRSRIFSVKLLTSQQGCEHVVAGKATAH